jgi:hypothetical protein
MTVTELIEELARCPDDSEVWDAVRCDLGAALVNDRVHVIGELSKKKLPAGLTPLTVKELIDELVDFPRTERRNTGLSERR